MKRCVVVLVAVCALWGIGSVHALQPADLGMDVSSLGDGWRYERAAPVGGPLETWEHRHTLFGPDGARAMILVYDIGQTISERGSEWDTLLDWLSLYAGYHAFGAQDDPNFGFDDMSSVPGGIDDAIREEYVDDYGEPFGYGLYAITDTRLAIMVIVEGAVNGLTGVAATDYIAGLYLAALSGQ